MRKLKNIFKKPEHGEILALFVSVTLFAVAATLAAIFYSNWHASYLAEMHDQAKLRDVHLKVLYYVFEHYKVTVDKEGDVYLQRLKHVLSPHSARLAMGNLKEFLNELHRTYHPPVVKHSIPLHHIVHKHHHRLHRHKHHHRHRHHHHHWRRHRHHRRKR